jgi:hypothetical protein
MMRKIWIVAILATMMSVPAIQAAQASSPKPGSPCAPKDANTNIGGHMFHCAVIPAKWATSTQTVWQNADAWSAAVDAVINKLDVKTRYQYCLVQNGAPLPGKSGAVPSNAIMACQVLPGAPKSANTNTSTDSSAPGFSPDIKPEFISCLKSHGYEAKNMNDLIMGIHNSSSSAAYKACVSLAPQFIAQQIK